jgi:RNA polymerase sigma factor (sigma-70 family)
MTTAGTDEKFVNQKTLIDQFRSGDFTAFASLYQTHIQALLHYGNKVITDKEMVKDVIHDLFVELWNRRQTLMQVNNLEFYMLKALRYKLMKLNKGGWLQYLEEDDPVTENFSFTIDALLEEKESRQNASVILQKAINALPLRQREVIYFRFYKGYSNQQIADLLNINYQSVSNLLQRAIETLKNAIPGYSIELLSTYILTSYIFF